MLYSICQRYNFESNLQHILVSSSFYYGCIRYVKDTILKAIYNTRQPNKKAPLLYSICQRYNFESNLQPRSIIFDTANSCIRYVKDTILKAIYNRATDGKMRLTAVFDMSKIQFWKQFTTTGSNAFCPSKLYSICQRYNFESNLQPRKI